MVRSDSRRIFGIADVLPLLDVTKGAKSLQHDGFGLGDDGLAGLRVTDGRQRVDERCSERRVLLARYPSFALVASDDDVDTIAARRRGIGPGAVPIELKGMTSDLAESKLGGIRSADG